MPEACAAGGETITAISGPVTKMSLTVSSSAGFRGAHTLSDISAVIGQAPSSLSLAHRESTPLRDFVDKLVHVEDQYSSEPPRNNRSPCERV